MLFFLRPHTPEQRPNTISNRIKRERATKAAHSLVQGINQLITYAICA